MLLSLDLLLSFFQLLLEVDSSRFDGAMLFGKRLDLGQGEGKLVSNGGEFGFDSGRVLVRRRSGAGRFRRVLLRSLLGR
jgi:hypothetical protein